MFDSQEEREVSLKKKRREKWGGWVIIKNEFDSHTRDILKLIYYFTLKLN